MEILKFDNAAQPAPRKSKKGKSNAKAFTALATIAAVAVLGSTLAANITLNNGSSLEFGQGVQVTTACEGTGNSITVTPNAVFSNVSGGGSFNFASVGFANIQSGCYGKTFTMQAYGDTSATPLQLGTSSGGSALTSATFSLAYATASPTVASGFTAASSGGTLSLQISTPASTAGAVFKLTLQTQ